MFKENRFVFFEKGPVEEERPLEKGNSLGMVKNQVFSAFELKDDEFLGGSFAKDVKSNEKQINEVKSRLALLGRKDLADEVSGQEKTTDVNPEVETLKESLKPLLKARDNQTKYLLAATTLAVVLPDFERREMLTSRILARMKEKLSILDRRISDDSVYPDSFMQRELFEEKIELLSDIRKIGAYRFPKFQVVDLEKGLVMKVDDTKMDRNSVIDEIKKLQRGDF